MPVPRKIIRNHKHYYQHSSPPKVIHVNNQNVQKTKISGSLVIKPSSIRIWIHEKDIKKLTKVLWEGQGMRLCRETSSNRKVKQFLDAVPYVMATIKDVHTAAINNDLDLLEAASADPVPPEMLACKDTNGLTPLHKAAGLGHLECLEYILLKYPNAATIEDNTGKTALHWASAKNNFRAFNLLVQAGADEIANDHHMRHPAYYRSKPHEVDKSLLHVIPEAPRVPKKPPSFDWSMFFDEDAANNNEPRLVQSLLSSRLSNPSESSNMRKAKSTDPIKQLEPEAEPLKIASYSMEHIVDKTFEDLESESRSRNNSESQETEQNEISENNHFEELNGNHLENHLELEPENVEEENQEKVEVEEINNNNVEENDDENPPLQEDDDATGNEVSNLEDAVANNDEGSKANGGDQSTTEDAEYADDENESESARNNTENEVQNEIETDEVPTPIHTQNETNAEVLVINSDEAEHEKDDASTSSSPSPEMEISGIVQGEPDTDQLESQGDPKYEDDEDIKKLIESGDMEKLAGLVLNGHGHKLDGFKSDHPEIQSFLDNVPAYMDKIKKVHIAAKDGNLRDLQAALDRRKFATARDQVSPFGGTPLHVATIFGHAGIVRYLAGRFSETLQAKDDNGRTALHYAAVINDNGHFYNLLLQLGANPDTFDNEGNTAEFYTKNDQSDTKLSHKQLLRDYGADESLADDMLLDQVPDDSHSARRLLDDPEQIQTLERCFNLIQEQNSKEEGKMQLPSNSVPGSAGAIRVSVTSYLARFLTKTIFDRIKRRQTRLDHNLFDLIWPAMKKAARTTPVDEELNAGIVVPDFDAYVVFQEFLVPLIKDLHCLDPNQSFIPQPEVLYFPEKFLEENNCEKEFHLILDHDGTYMAEGVIEVCRNLENFELPLNLNLGQLEQSERTLTGKILSMEFAKAIGEEEIGVYYTMNEVFEKRSLHNRLQSSGLLIPLFNPDNDDEQPESIAINNHLWPYGRGVFLSHNGDLAAWINAQEHLRLLCTTKLGNVADIGAAYFKISQAMNFLEHLLEFRHSYFLGNLSSRPAYLGSSLKINVLLALPYLRKERANLRHLCNVRGLNMKLEVNDTLIRLSNMQSLGITEWKLFQDYCTAVTNILQLEKDLSTSTTSQITESFIRLLRHVNNGQIEIPLFRTEEGVYLATSLGDPLIKGLTEVANVRPPDPITFLANYLLDFARKQNQLQGAEEISSVALVSGDPSTDLQEANTELFKQRASGKSIRSTAAISAAIEAPSNSMDHENAPEGHQSTTPGDDRDEHGQSILHFACARSHGKNALIQLIEESETSITYRDELYRTARDVSLQANQPDNAREIDRYVVQLAARGDSESLANMVWEGYDHILDATDADGTSIEQVARARGHQEVVTLLESLNDFEQLRENLLSAIRAGDLEQVKKVGAQSDMSKLTKAKNYYGRCSLHVAVLLENEEIVDFLASNFRATLHIGDNLARTPLHYAMGIDKVEAISRILIKNGAKRVVKDLKGRQPSYYFMNKADILRLQEEEKE
ncbi:uncharacterized protein LOC134828816 [Culicoides brevitarsis]|uniref:uncharacterized protein LOC134828816 n=1 Tax=Culicoides brevitarsis TaxID=469753 RepID=UPI00307B9754